MPENTPRAADYARLITVPAIWGGTFVAGKIVVATLTPLMGSFARYLIACVALLAAAFVLEGGLPKLTGRQWLATFVLGLFGVFAYNLFFMGALTRLPASRAALIIALNPAVTIAISAVVLKERLSARRWAGVMLALLGVAVVVSRGDFRSFASGGVGAGELYMFAAVTSWALYTILGRRVLGGLSPLAATNYAALWGTILLGAVAAPQFDTLRFTQFDWPTANQRGQRSLPTPASQLAAQSKWAGVRSATLQLDPVAGPRGVERSLEITTGWNPHSTDCARNSGRLHGGPRRLCHGRHDRRARRGIRCAATGEHDCESGNRDFHHELCLVARASRVPLLAGRIRATDSQ